VAISPDKYRAIVAEFRHLQEKWIGMLNEIADEDADEVHYPGVDAFIVSTLEDTKAAAMAEFKEKVAAADGNRGELSSIFFANMRTMATTIFLLGVQLGRTDLQLIECTRLEEHNHIPEPHLN